MNKNALKELPGLLLAWYADNKRDLAWRQDTEPYHIWLSEIMLQQTRVEAVKGYYSRFLQKLPTIADLAEADDDALAKLWEGLGYYTRVRNIKKAAQKIMQEHGGVFPNTYEEVLALPGIGAYTAGAICSIAFGLPTPAVDGNVLRLVARLTDDDTPIDEPAYKKQVNQMLAEIYPSDTGAFTQALIELGATVCGPNRKPDCPKCPCRAICKAHKSGRAEKLPVRLPKRKRRTEDMTVFILSCDGCYAVEKRSDTGLLAGLWQFPNVPGTLETADALKALEEKGLRPTELMRQVDKKHIFTHITWNMRGFYIAVAEQTDHYIWRTPQQISDDTALPTAFGQFFEDIIV